MWAQLIPTILSLASGNKDGGAKAQDIGSMVRMFTNSGKTAKSIKDDIYS